MPADPHRIQFVFLAAVEIGDPAERARHLAAACGESHFDDIQAFSELAQALTLDQVLQGFQAEDGGNHALSIAIGKK